MWAFFMPSGQWKRKAYVIACKVDIGDPIRRFGFGDKLRIHVWILKVDPRF